MITLLNGVAAAQISFGPKALPEARRPKLKVEARSVMFFLLKVGLMVKKGRTSFLTTYDGARKLREYPKQRQACLHSQTH
jgi:hypothetical protein